MNRVRKAWIQLCNNATACCNEPFGNNHDNNVYISLETLGQVIEQAKANQWQCLFLTGIQAVSTEVQSLCSEVPHSWYIPAGYIGETGGQHFTLVFDSENMSFIGRYPASLKALLRVRRSDLCRLSDLIIQILKYHQNLSVKHPELTKYNDADLECNRVELAKVGQWIFRENRLSSCRVDCLTDGLTRQATQDCGAGDTAIAVGPSGHLYLCPADIHRDISCGHIAEQLNIPNRHLLDLGKTNVCPCECQTRYCRRCVYQNRESTCEVCIPSANHCKLMYSELWCQAQLYRAALESGQWRNEWDPIFPPHVWDPFDIVKGSVERRKVGWAMLNIFGGTSRHLNPAVQMNIIHRLWGTSRILSKLMRKGHIPPHSILEDDSLCRLRGITIERFRDSRLIPETPTINEIEQAMFRAARQTVKRSFDHEGDNQSCS